MGGNGGVGGEQGGSGGTGEGPRINYGSIQTPQFIVNNQYVGTSSSKTLCLNNNSGTAHPREILASLKHVAARYDAVDTPQKCMAGTRVNTIGDLVACLTGTPDSIRVVMLRG